MLVGSRDSRHLDANFTIRSEARLVIFFEAAGGSKDRARNTEYHTGLIELLRRLGELRAVIEEIRVETAITKKLPPNDRRIRLKKFGFPLSVGLLSDHDFGNLKSDISTSARRPGKRPGSAGGGSSRNLEILLAPMSMTSEQLSNYLSEPRA